MADLTQLQNALINADKAGDVDAARALAAEITRQRAVVAQPASAPAPVSAPAQVVKPAVTLSNTANAPAPAPAPLSRTDKFVQGLRDPIDGGAQFLTHLLPDNVVKAGNNLNNWIADKTSLVAKIPDGGVDQMVRDNDAAYQKRRAAQGESGFDGYRTLGNIPTDAAMLAAAPAAGTIGGGILAGAASGAISPVTQGDNYWGQKGMQVGAGAVAGGVIPAALRVGKIIKAGAIDPFTDAGRGRVVGRALRNAASDPTAAATNMTTRTGATPGFMPTAGQASDDAGVASLERAARAIDPGGFGDIDMSQRGALVGALRGIAKTPEDRAAALAAVDAKAKDLYGQAFQESTPVTPALTNLSYRPSMRKAEERAINLSSEMGIPFNARLQDMQPQMLDAGVRELPPSSITDSVSQYNPMTLTSHNVDVDRLIPSGSVPNTVSIPPVDSVPVRDMHTLKMGMDALLQDPTQGIAGREAAALKATRNRLLDQLPESYQVARQAHIEMNKPVNQMDIGKELYNRFVPALADGADIPFKTRADSFANALRNGDSLAKNVTGLKNATMEGIMTPEQMATLRGVSSDAAMVGAANSAGRGVGSDTVQKMSMSNLIDQAGLPSWVGALKPLAPVGGWVKTAGDILYTKNDEAMRHLLANTLKDPAKAAAAMQQAGVPPGKYADLIRQIAQASAMGTANSTN